MGEFPAHASPALKPIPLSPPQNPSDELERFAAPPPLVSPALTPPRPSYISDGQRHDREPAGAAAGSDAHPDDPAASHPDSALEREEAQEQRPHLLQSLPEVMCEVRARIPTTTGMEMWLHLYHNSADDKEHLAIVFGPHIRSASLDASRPGESERDRMIRGAYVGTLYPGRVSSRVQQIRHDAGVDPDPARPSAAYLAGLNPSPPAASPVGSSSPPPAAVDEYFQTMYPAHLGPPLVRIHSECYTGETVWSARCDCGEQLDEAARLMSEPIPSRVGTPVSESGGVSGEAQLGPRLPPCGGVIIYLRQEGRGIGLLSKLKAYNLQDLGHDTMEANLLLRHPGDARSYGLATAMLLDLGLGGDRGIKLLTNNPEKVRAVEGPNREVKVVQRVPMIPLAWKSGGREGVHGPEVEKYISTKIEKFKHMFSE